MKVISKSQLKPTELSALHTEISTLQLLSLSHPNIIHLYAHFTIANELYLIMDLCTGGELFDLICELGAFYEDDAQRIISVLLDAVAHLHENGIVHRDIKPENILIRTPVDIDHLAGENGNGNGTEKFVPKRDIVLADFGISKVLRPESKELLRTRIGSPGYMAPEVIKGEPYGSAVDVWAIGVIAYLL
jgi:serine/threonine protein kinase